MEAITPMKILRKKIRRQIRRRKQENEALRNLIRALDPVGESSVGRIHPSGNPEPSH